MFFCPIVGMADTGSQAAPWDAMATPFFRHLTIPRDLPNVVSAIAQDNSGMIWLGTQSGLVRWDGYRPKLFEHDPDNPNSLPANLVSGLLVDERGRLLVSTVEGVVASYDPATERFTSLPPTNTGTGVYSAFAADGSGGLWMGNGNGLSHLAAGASVWTPVDVPSHSRVWSLVRAQDGTLWAGTDHGLLRKASGNTPFTPYSLKTAGDAPPLTNIRMLMQAGNGEIWFGTNDGRVGALGEEGQVKFAQMPASGNGILAIVESKPGLICVGTAGSGVAFINRADGKLLQHLSFDPLHPSGLGENFIYALFVDRSQELWVGHFHGADYAPAVGDAFRSLLPSDRDVTALRGSYVAAMEMMSDGNVLVGTEKGVDLFTSQSGRMPASNLPDAGLANLPASLVYGFASSSDGRTWVATSQGLFESAHGKITRFAQLGDTPVRTLLIDDQTLWIGTDRVGLAKLDLVTRALSFHQHDPADPTSISDNFVLSIVKDPHRGLWVGTQHGLNLFDGQRFHSFLHKQEDPESLPGDPAPTIIIDSQQRLWVGTHGGGLAVLKGEPSDDAHFIHIGRSTGLPSDNVGKLIEDRDGRIWASTDSGVAVIDPQSFQARAFGEADGISIGAYYTNSGGRAKDGTLLFGGLGGITVIHPERLADWDFHPNVAVTAVRLGGRDVPAGTALTVPAQDHSLQVEFTSLDYSAPEKNHYAYRLAGFDPDWIQADADHRLAAYTNLPPGSYTLLLRGSNRNGIWTDPPLRLPVTVLPAWYQTIWFRLALLAAGVGVVFAIVRSRTAYLRRRQRELETQVAERTAEISSLLHNSGEGFLSFGADLTIDRQYSSASELFLGEVPAGKNAAALLFAENPKQAAFVTESVPAALTSSDPQKRDLILSLLPPEIDRRGRRLKARYTVIENNHLMVVLRDITTERRLAERVASEHRRLGLIVAAVTDSRDFFDAVTSFREFISAHVSEELPWHGTPAALLQEVYRQVHTFKGVFNQFSMEKTPAALHGLEERLDDLRRSLDKITAGEITGLLQSARLWETLNQDLAVVRKALGEHFLEKGGQVSMTPAQATEIKRLAAKWRKGEPVDLGQPEIKRILDEIEKVGAVSLKSELAGYDQTIAQVALRLGKEVAPLKVDGEDLWLDPDIYGPFLRSLIHVFRNCVAHGIEAPEVRLERDKEEFGLIACSVKATRESFAIEIVDDGAGIDLDGLREDLRSKGRYPAEELAKLSDREIASHVFQDNISSARETDEWSGRGVGLAAVSREVERLGGTTAVESTMGSGTSFIFTLRLPEHSTSRAA